MSASAALPALVSELVFRRNSDLPEYLIVVVFESKEVYQANAESPEQHARYLDFREFPDADPERLDREVFATFP